MQNYLQLEKIFEKSTQLNNLMSVINWDFTTQIPKNSAETRSIEMSTLNEIIQKIITDEKVEELINNAESEVKNLNDWQKSNFELIKKEFISNKIIPSELQKEYHTTSLKSEFVWREAKKK